MKKDLEAKARREAAAAGPSGRSHEGGSSSSSRGGRVDHWLYPGIIVKVMSKALKEHGYYKQKVREQAGRLSRGMEQRGNGRGCRTMER